jgi:hypothetical protein
MKPDAVVIYETEIETEAGKVKVQLIVPESELEYVARVGIPLENGVVTFNAVKVEDPS